MADIALLADYAEIIGAATVLGAVLFAVVQIREFRRQRVEALATELVRAVQTPAFTQASRVVMDLPDALDASQIAARPEVVDAAFQVGWVWESLGVLVYRRIMPLYMVEDLVGGLVPLHWRKVAALFELKRREQESPSLAEWFQWLAERLEEHRSPGKRLGAHVAYRAWRP